MNIDTTDSINAKAQILGIVTVNASPQYVIYATSVQLSSVGRHVGCVNPIKRVAVVETVLEDAAV
jgi:uncharacterized protein (DUF4213/DUF364 family)